MSGRRALALSLGGLALLLTGLALLASGGVVLEFAGLALLLLTGYTLVAPLAQTQVYYRVRYHYLAAAVEQNGLRSAALLRLLARRGGRVSLYWRRGDAGMELYIAISATVEAAFRGMIAEIWPGAVVERVTAPPLSPQTAACLYGIRGGEPAPQFDFAALLADTATAPATLWLHLTAVGWTTLVGAPCGARTLAGLRLRALRGGAQGNTLARLAWLYPFVQRWPNTPAGRRAPPVVRWPHTDLLPSLDAEIALILPPPPEYQAPRRLWQLGRAVSGDQPIGLDLDGERKWGHVLVIGGTGGERQGTALRLLAQAGAAGWGVVALDHSGRLGKQLYELAPAEVRRGSARIDLHARRGTLRPGLLDVAAPPGHPAGQARALLVALETRLPAYLRYLGQLGLQAAATGPAREIAPSDVTIQLLAHYRARLVGGIAPPLPEVPVLYAAWANMSGYGERLRGEIAAWGQPEQALRNALAAAGEPGRECARQVERLLSVAAANLAALDPADLQLYGGSLRARLAPAATAPLLRAAWSELTPANMALAGPLLLGNLGYGDSGERGAARVYGLYLLALLEAVAAERALLGPVQQPIAVAWEELAPAWSALKPADISRLGATLRAGAIHLIALDEGWRGLDEAQGGALRAVLDNWVVGTLPANLAATVGAELASIGAPASFSCSALPPGHALARWQAGPAPLLCTVITAAAEMGLPATVQRSSGGERNNEPAAAPGNALSSPLVVAAGAREGE